MREMKDSGVEWLGEVPAGWSVVPVKRVAVLRHGSDPQKDGDVPVYGSGQFAFKTCGEFKEGPTVLLGRKGTLNCPQYIVGRYWNVDTAFDTVIRSNEMLLKYFYYSISSVDVGDLSTNTAKPSMTQGAWYSVKLPKPPLDEQRRIAGYLDEKCAEIDRAVSAAERSIEEYKLLLSAVIDERFSQYGGRVKLSRISSLITDGDHQAPPRSDVGIPFLVISNISKGKIDFSNTDYVPEKYYESLPISRRAQKGDVLVSVTGSYGIPVVVDVERPFCFQRHIALVRPSVNPDYIRFAMKTTEFSQYCDGVVTGAAQKTLTLGCLRSAPIIDVPSAEVDMLVGDLLAKEVVIDRAIAAKQAIIADLKAYKQSLIYETVTGKREV